MEPDAAPLTTHLGELRTRLLIAAGAWAAASALAYAFAPQIYALLLRPLVRAGADHPVIYTGLAEAFLTYLRLAAFAGAFVGLPVLLAQIWAFAAPGLTSAERRAARPLIAACPLLFAAGAAFVFFVVLPAVLPFFLGFQTEAGPLPILSLTRVAAYLDFTLGLMLAFGLAFQLPLALILAARAGLVSRAARSRRYAVIAAFAVAAVLTPPDVLSQCLLAGALITLYEGGLLLIPRGPRPATGGPQSPQPPPKP